MAGNITRLRIEGLHNRQIIDIPIQDNKLILVGENGTGKSTVANFLYSILTSQWSRLLEYTFKKISVTVDMKEFAFSYLELKLLEEASGNKWYDQILDMSLGKNHIQTWDDVKEHRKELISINDVPITYINKLVKRYSHIPLSLLKREKNLKSKISVQVLYLPTYRRIERDLETILGFDTHITHKTLQRLLRNNTGSFDFITNHLATNNNKNILDKDAHYLELVEFGMNDVKETLAEKMNQIKENVRQDLSNLTGEYLRDMIRGAYQTVRPSQLKSIDDPTVDKLFQRIPKEILSPEDKNSLRENIAKIHESSEIDDSTKVVAHFLTKLAELNKKQVRDEKDIRDFVEVCNKYLSGKSFIYDDISFEVYVKPNGGKENRLKLSDLSSGEKQIVSLFSHIYLSNNSDFFVIIDEPELSLSVPWQSQFLPDMLQRCKGLVAVTHSPFIFDNELRPYTKAIREYIHPFEYDPNLENRLDTLNDKEFEDLFS